MRFGIFIRALAGALALSAAAAAVPAGYAAPAAVVPASVPVSFTGSAVPAAGCAAHATSAEAPAAQTSAPKPAPKSKAQSYIEAVSRGDLLRSSVFGVLAVTEGGDTLASWNSGQRMLPASTMKLVTTGMAIHRLGPDFRYVTRIGHNGTVKDGVLDGDLYIVGGGDPTIASKDSIALPQERLFGQWKSFLDKAGIKRINGNVIGDGRYFDGPAEQDCWSYQDIGTAYGAGPGGLSFYENAQDFKVSAGASVGSPVSVTPVFPVTPWMKYEYSCKTAPAGTGDQLYLFNTEFCPRAEVRGSFAIDRRPKTEEFSNRFGAYTCAHYFREFLEAGGVTVAGSPADVRGGRVRSDLSSSEYGPYASRVDDLTMLGMTYSPTLGQIARATNLKSDNFYAETLFRTLGRRLRHSASYDSTYAAVSEVMKSLGVNAEDVRIVDGSGLARHNYVSPSFLVRFLSAMMDSPAFGDYIRTIGQPGDRHYESRLREAPAAVKSRVHLKSGSMNGVRCFSGYIEPSSGSKSDTIIFSIMTNNSLVPASRIDPMIDRFITLLAADN